METQSCCRINKIFLPVKMVYFLLLGGLVSFMPFVPVYMEQLGLSSAQIGLIRGMQPVAILIATPIFGALADKFSIHRAVMLVSMVLSGCCFIGTYFTPPVLNGTLINNASEILLEKDKYDWNDTLLTFTIMFSLMILGIGFATPVNAILDANTVELVKIYPGTDYGKQRLWGGLGWGSFAAFTGLAMDMFAEYFPDKNPFIPTYIIFGVVAGLAVVPASFMKFAPHRRVESISLGVFQIFRRIRVLVFVLVATVCGTCIGVVGTYQFLFLKELNAPSVVMGLTLTFTCLSEVPFMFNAKRIINKIGHEAVFVLTLFCYTVRFVGYSLLQNPWLILPIELLHGVCYGAYWPTATSFATLIAPPGMAATVISFVGAITSGLGMIIGVTGGGYIYDLYGPRFLFRLVAIVCATTMVFYIFYCSMEKLAAKIKQRRRHLQYEQI